MKSTMIKTRHLLSWPRERALGLLRARRGTGATTLLPALPAPGRLLTRRERGHAVLEVVLRTLAGPEEGSTTWLEEGF